MWSFIHANDVPYNPLHDAGTRASAARHARRRWRTAKTHAPGAGAGARKPSAGCTRPPRCRCSCVSEVPERMTARRTASPAGSFAAGRGFIVWFTGLSGAGKSTLAEALRRQLSGGRPVEILDGDEVRTQPFEGPRLQQGRPRRQHPAHRVRGPAAGAERRADRSRRRSRRTRTCARRCGGSRRRNGVPFIEVFVEAPLGVLVERDVKGLYRQGAGRRDPALHGRVGPVRAADVAGRARAQRPRACGRQRRAHPAGAARSRAGDRAGRRGGVVMETSLFPVFLKLAGRRVLVVGAGRSPPRRSRACLRRVRRSPWSRPR